MVNQRDGLKDVMDHAMPMLRGVDPHTESHDVWKAVFDHTINEEELTDFPGGTYNPGALIPR